MSEQDATTGTDPGETPDSTIPDWDDEYVDRVSDRLMFNYDLEKDRAVAGTTFTLYGEMTIDNRKHMFHPSISFAHHELREHLFVSRTSRVRTADLERLVELGHELADEWIVADEEHYSTDFTFAVVTESIPDDVRAFVEGFKDRTLLKYGYHGHYEINLLVVAPDEQDVVASEEASVEQAFRLWEPIEREEPGLLDLIARRLQL